MTSQTAFRPSQLALAVAVAVTSMSAPLAVHAQQSSKDSSTVQSLGTVTVTATRRREPVRDVPVQLNVVPAEELEQGGAKSLTDYMAAQPGIEVKGNGGAGLGSPSIRGITTGEQPSPSVGVYIDDVPFGSSSVYGFGANTALDLGLLDIKQVEILRGPQGTLYGASSMGGLIKYVTRSPDLGELSGKVTLGLSSTRNGGVGNTAAGVINVPIKEDVAAVRLSVFRERAGGFIDAAGPIFDSNVDTGTTTGLRASLLYSPSNQLYVRLSATGQDIDREGSAFIDYSPVTGQPLAGDLKTPLSVTQPYKMKVRLGSLDVEYDMGWARLNSITSVQQSELAQRSDLTSIYGPVLASFGLPLSQVMFDRTPKIDKETQEFRLTSNGRGPFEWLGGVFYNPEKGQHTQLINGVMASGGPSPLLLLAAIPTDYRELAVYGDVTWNFAPSWSATVGARVARNEQTFAQIGDGLLVGGPSTASGSSKETAKTYLATVKYALTPTSNVYVRAASGYRPGGPNPLILDPATGTPLLPPTFAHDDLWSYELGYKADLLDRTLGVEASIYDVEWKNMQQLFAVGGIGALINAGRARIKGGELALHYRPTNDLDVDLALTSLDARLVENAPGLGPAGSRLPDSAHFSASVGATYKFDVAGHRSYVGMNVSHVGERNAGFKGSPSFPGYELPAYTLTNLRAGTQWGRTDVAFYVRNVFDKRAQLSGTTAFVPVGGPVRVNVEQPRTVGVTVTANF
jgi:outer membrane receptor protein involved in Fe transport